MGDVDGYAASLGLNWGLWLEAVPFLTSLPMRARGIGTRSCRTASQPRTWKIRAASDRLDPERVPKVFQNLRGGGGGHKMPQQFISYDGMYLCLSRRQVLSWTSAGERPCVRAGRARNTHQTSGPL